VAAHLVGEGQQGVVENDGKSDRCGEGTRECTREHIDPEAWCILSLRTREIFREGDIIKGGDDDDGGREGRGEGHG
jgi:hypothetical protein